MKKKKKTTTNDTKLPSIDNCYFTLKGKNFTEEEHKRAISIWILIKCKTLLDYTSRSTY